MTNMKNKLSASVRQAKANQQKTTAKTAKGPAVLSPPTPKLSTPQPAKASTAKSGGVLFPDRVWPD